MARATLQDILVPGITGKYCGVDHEADRQRHFKSIMHALGGVVWGKPGPVKNGGDYNSSYYCASIMGQKLSLRYVLMHNYLPLISCATHPDEYAGSFEYVESPDVEALIEPPFLWVGGELFEARMRYPLRGDWIDKLDKRESKVIAGFQPNRICRVIFNTFD